MTTVAQLIARLQKLPLAAQVVVAKDSEGNGFSPIAVEHPDASKPDISVGFYVPESTWAGEFYTGEFHQDDKQAGGVDAVCLWPTN